MKSLKVDEQGLREVRALETCAIPALGRFESKYIKEYVKQIAPWVLQYEQACQKAYPLSVQEPMEQIRQWMEKIQALGSGPTSEKQRVSGQEKVQTYLSEIEKIVNQQEQMFEGVLQESGYEHLESKNFVGFKGDKAYVKQHRARYGQWLCDLMDLSENWDVKVNLALYQFEVFEKTSKGWEHARSDGGANRWMFGCLEQYDPKSVGANEPFIRGETFRWSTGERLAVLPLVISDGCGHWNGQGAPTGQALTVNARYYGKRYRVCFEDELNKKIVKSGSGYWGGRTDSPVEAIVHVPSDRLESTVWCVDGKIVAKKDHPLGKAMEEKKMLARELKKPLGTVGAQKIDALGSLDTVVQSAVKKLQGAGEALQVEGNKHKSTGAKQGRAQRL